MPIHDPGLVSDVETALRDGENVAALQRCLENLRKPLPVESLAWIHERYASTVGAGLIGAMQAVCPDLEVDDLRADFELMSSDDGEPFSQITISEDQPGGSGVVEAAVDRITEDPRAFWAVVTRVLGPCDGERIDDALRRFLRDRDEGHLAGEVEQVRASSTLHATTEAWASLRERMFLRGLDADQTVVNALATRLLRPGSDKSVEQLCRNLLGRWDALEEALGLEVDLRVFAYIAARDGEIRRALAAITPNTDQNPEVDCRTDRGAAVAPRQQTACREPGELQPVPSAVEHRASACRVHHTSTRCDRAVRHDWTGGRTSTPGWASMEPRGSLARTRHRQQAPCINY